MVSIDSKALVILWTPAITRGEYHKEMSSGGVLGKCLGTFWQMPKKPNPRVEKEN